MARLLAIMGSGETAPTMIKPHRGLIGNLGPGEAAVLLNTPYGFQENADDISNRATAYFAASVGHAVEVVDWRVAPEPGLARERALADIAGAGWVFAGPGSPTYTLRQWRGTPIPDLLAEKLTKRGVVVFASAAALTLGSHTVPVYEIYKAGLAPFWDDGLDLVRRVTGVPAIVIPHYDNAEGGHHDTRYCYLGERRLAQLERSLPEQSVILGVDEHTGVILDLDTQSATVLGNGALTLRRRGHSLRYPSGSTLTFADLRADSPGAHAAGPHGGPTVSTNADDASSEATNASPRSVSTHSAGSGVPDAAPSVLTIAVTIEERFTSALAARAVDDCVSAILELEQSLMDWSSDTTVSNATAEARLILRRMVLRLGDLCRHGVHDRRSVLEPFVTELLALRAQARGAKDFATADRIRQHLAASGVDVRDTPAGAQWEPSG